MTFRDLWHMCLNNLKRRRSRTILTVLGVMIGCMSIVIMVSIGAGLSVSQEKMLAQMGDLRQITIYPNYDPSAQAVKLDEQTITQIQAIPNVQAATGKFEITDYPVRITSGTNGRYETAYTNMVGIDFSQLENFGYEIKEGTYPSPGLKNQALAGERFAYSFTDTARPEGSNRIDIYSVLYDENGQLNEDLPDPYFDPLQAKVNIDVQVQEDANAEQEVSVCGIVKENYSAGYETSEGLIIDLNDMKELWKAANKKAGKSNGNFTYSQAVVMADTIDDVSEIEKEIQNLGFQTSSMESMRQSMQESTRLIQLVLGGIGAVSLLVAAIGIANTMIMSITERTKEIGIMKALGCYTKNIRQLFLLEAGVIGLIGGSIGLILSYIASFVMNYFSNQPAPDLVTQILYLLGVEGTPLSCIPLWLALGALVFSMLVGIVSGYYPANKAVKIPALEAIRHD